MFSSILYRDGIEPPLKSATDPDFFFDLNLDQIFDPLRRSMTAYDANLIVRRPLQDPADVRYRQDIMRDFEHRGLREVFRDFAKFIHDTEEYLSELQKLLTEQQGDPQKYYLKSCILELGRTWVSRIDRLLSDLSKLKPKSAGLLAFVEFLEQYRQSEPFVALRQEAEKLKAAFGELHFTIRIKDTSIYVRPYEGQESLNPEIEALFARFRQADAPGFDEVFPTTHTAQHIDSAILHLLAEWYPELFDELDTFIRQHGDFCHPVIVRFAREVSFYIDWQSYCAPLRKQGLDFCYPKLDETGEDIHFEGAFDLALARDLCEKGSIVVTNDFKLQDPERILVVTGPNQGGKTTFARSIGQFFYLTALGCCVPGRDASVFLTDGIHTHFGKEEELAGLSGRLQDDLLRLKEILAVATDKSLVIVNEIFASTTYKDALELGKKMFRDITERGSVMVCVTFVDELANCGTHTVSMMSLVDPKEPGRRTFKVSRRAADGKAYAMYLADKYGLTYEALTERLAQ